MGNYRVAEFNPGQYTLLRNEEPSNHSLNNAELQFWMERESYRKALEAAQRVMWMAEKYADGGRTEREDCEQANEDIKAALAECGL
jgi:hypothetical protein